MTEWVNEYISALNKAPSCDEKEKTIKNKEYVDGLLNNGGPSTDQFIKMIGREKTTTFFYKYFFGIEE